MSKSSVSKLVPARPRRARAPSRRQQYSASTKRALVDVAEELFTENGYAATSLDAIVAGAEVTKGALYHHFSGKQALFEAVFERVEERRRAGDPAGAQGPPRPVGEGDRPGCGRSSTVVQEPRYRRIVIQEGPAVLGYERYREQEERSTFANVLEIVRSVLEAGEWELDEDLQQTFARIFFGAMSSAGESVSSAPDPIAAAAATSRPRSASSWPASRPSPRAASSCPPAARQSRPASLSLDLLGEGDVAVRGRDQLDPGVTGRDGQLAGLGRQLERRVQVGLRPGAADQLAVVEEHRLALAVELGLRHRVAGRVGVAGVADLDPQHQHGVGRELVAVGGVGVLVDVALAVEGPVRGVPTAEAAAIVVAGWPPGGPPRSPHGR